MPTLKDMNTWTDRNGALSVAGVYRRRRPSLARAESGEAVELGEVAREGHEVAWEYDGPGGAYTGRMLINGEILTPSDATKRFLKA